MPTPMKLIIEHSYDGHFYVYREDEKHHAAMQRNRAPTGRKSLAECDQECELLRGEYVVVDLKKGQK
jgi:hypothetical protein